MILDDIADLLTTAGIGTKGIDIFIGEQTPDLPNQLIMIRLYEGLPSLQTFGMGVGGSAQDRPRIQVEVRSTTYTGADTLCREVRNTLDRLGNTTINSKVSSI